MIQKTALLLRTARYLKWRQIYFRIHYQARDKFRALRKFRYPQSIEKKSVPLKFAQLLANRQSYRDGEFAFINRSKRFSGGIDWHFNKYGKLWSYNLNYFDFLNQEELSKEEGLKLIEDFLNKIGMNKIGMEPYPISLRIINWVKFLVRAGARDESIDGCLYAQARVLLDNLEYHLMGNHLLENGFALLFAGLYFNDRVLYSRAREILTDELDEQIMDDGAHFELSPMYHQILLFRLLDAINLLRDNASLKREMLEIFGVKASRMLGWLNRMTFNNGDIPLLNDSAYNIAPDTARLNAYAARLGVKAPFVELGVSGYRKIERPKYEMVADIGNIGPDYIPGHAHSDTFSFVLHAGGRPFIVDTGTSTYESGPMRNYQRSTAAHNTVTVEDKEQSEMWGSFRVGGRARVQDANESDNFISATHNGYARMGALHTRSFEFGDEKITVSDSVNSSRDCRCRAYFHFHPLIRPVMDGDTVVADGMKIRFSGSRSIDLTHYDYAPEFNMAIKAPMAVVSFHKILKTELFL